MNLTKDYQLPKELEGKSREEMIKYYSKIPKEKRKNIALSIQAIEIRDKSLISDDLYEAQQAIHITLLDDMVKELESIC